MSLGVYKGVGQEERSSYSGVFGAEKGTFEKLEGRIGNNNA